MENLDLCEILKDAPKGLKLYSTIYGEVEFYGFDDDDEECPVTFKALLDPLTSSVTKEGRHYFGCGECTLFPSFTNRDWSTFKLPYKLPEKGELCWTRLNEHQNWNLLFATGQLDFEGRPTFSKCQYKEIIPESYLWQPLTKVPEVLSQQLILK